MTTATKHPQFRFQSEFQGYWTGGRFVEGDGAGQRQRQRQRQLQTFAGSDFCAIGA
jgi:hypothetical protein